MNSNKNNKHHHQHHDNEEDIQPKFAMDISLFRFAKQLRLLGCDVLCDEVHKQHSLIEAAEQENRIVVTSVGKTIPLLHKYALIGDLTFGKAFENLKIVVVRGGKNNRNGENNNKQVQVVKKSSLRKKLKSNNDCDDDEEEEASDEGDNEKNDSENDNDDDEKNNQKEENVGAVSGYAAFLEDNSNNNQSTSSTAKTDPRKFHWVEEEDPSTKKMRRRRRRLVGYNSDGDSDYEYEEDKKTEAKIKQEEVDEEHEKVEETKSKSTSQKVKTLEEKQNHNNSSVVDEVMQSTTDEILRKLTALVKTATPGSVAAIAANACNSALRHAQKFPHHQSPAVRYIVVDIHATFKQMLSAIILISGVSWQPSVLFTRCVKDNQRIVDTKKQDVKDFVTPPIYRLYQNFYQCPQCKNVFWGVDNGLVVNFKSARTTEYLRSLFEDGAEANPLDEEEQDKNGNDDDADESNHRTSSPSSSFENDANFNSKTKKSGLVPSRTSRQSAKWGFMPRHIFSFPRKVKIVIFEFMTNEELDNLVLACPMFAELVDKKKNGLDMKFVREARMKKN